MATAYAAFTSLMTLISDLREHPYPPITLDDEVFKFLNSQVSFFQEFLEDHHTSLDLGLELRIAEAAYAVEDVIETHRAEDRVVDNHREEFNGSLHKAMEGVDLIKKEVLKLSWDTEKKIRGSKQPRRHADSAGESVVVGIEDPTIKIVDKLTRPHQGSGRRIISITGMGGIGKTTLANKVYNHPYVGNYFDVRAWATISKDYNTQENLLELLQCLGVIGSKESSRKMSEYELGEQLHKSLFGKRYLVIVDDLWDVEAWHRLRSFFPDGRGSGIVITTRETKFASISSHVFAVDLLDKGNTWNLFCKTVFGQDDCPRELEDVAKDISDKCRGLPLSVVVTGGHLAKSPRTQEYWEFIAQNLCSIVNSEDDGRCMKILSLSYIHLPVHLKPCFLYMGFFPEDGVIDVAKLIKLWVAEGFLKPICGKSLEEAAQDYIHELVYRNLVQVVGSNRRGVLTECKIHDLLRDLCLKEGLEKKFVCIVRKQSVPNNERRTVVYPSVNEEVVEGHRYSDAAVQTSPSVTRTLVLHDTIPSLVHKSLRVLAPITLRRRISLNYMVEITRDLVNLRYLDFSTLKFFEFVIIPSSLLSHWNLQFLFINCRGAKAPEEIWKMSQLRHISVDRNLCLPEPPSESHGDILRNLQSAERILNFNFSEDSVKRIPNVRILIVEYNDGVEGFSEAAYALENIARLEKLEKFNCNLHSVRSVPRRNIMVSSLTFPHSLKELTVTSHLLDDVTMTKIGSLPLLEELRLVQCSGREWEHVDGQFVRLKSLGLLICEDLECFTADSSHFPCLEELELSFMDSLNEISSDIGDIQTLRCIKLFRCPDSAVVCAKEIAEYQKHEMGNEQLQIMVRLHPTSSRLSVESLSASNFIVENWE